MSRIRTIKPEFFTSEDIVSLSPLARLFYVSLWCEADREGRFEWKPRTLKMRYLPADNCDVEALGKELIDAGMVQTYQVDGRTYAVIPGFTRHQVINNREQESSIPAPPSAKPPQSDDASLTRESGRKEGKEGKGKEDASLGDDDSLAGEPAASRQKPNTTPVGELCKRIRQEGRFTGVSPADPTLLALMESGYTNDEIFEVCKEAAEKSKPWGWALKVIQARREDAAKVKAAPPAEDRTAKFVGGI